VKVKKKSCKLTLLREKELAREKIGTVEKSRRGTYKESGNKHALARGRGEEKRQSKSIVLEERSRHKSRHKDRDWNLKGEANIAK